MFPTKLLFLFQSAPDRLPMKMYSNRHGQRGQRAPNPYRQNFQFTPMSQPTPFVPSYVRQPRVPRMPRAPRFSEIERAPQRRPSLYRPPKREFSDTGDLAAQAAQIATQAYQQGVEHTFQMMAAKQAHRPPPQNQRPFQPRPSRNMSQNYNRQKSYFNQKDQQSAQGTPPDPMTILAGMQQQITNLTQQFQKQNIGNDGDAPMTDVQPPVRTKRAG